MAFSKGGGLSLRGLDVAQMVIVRGKLSLSLARTSRKLTGGTPSAPDNQPPDYRLPDSQPPNYRWIVRERLHASRYPSGSMISAATSLGASGGALLRISRSPATSSLRLALSELATASSTSTLLDHRPAS